MKNWNAAEIVEMNIAETANGCLPWLWESCITDNVMDNGCGNENEGNKGDGEQTPENSLS